MAEYTYKDIIIDPESEEAKNAIGKEVYYTNWPMDLLKFATEDKDKGILTIASGLGFLVNDTFWQCIIVKKEPPKPKYVPFENMDEFLTAYMRQDVTRLSPRDTTIFVRGFWLKYDSEYIQIILFSEKTILTSYAWENFESMLEKFTFLDGTPCGKEVKDE